MKKILALFAVLLVAFMVFACGQAATTTANKTTEPAATTTTQAEVTTTKPEVTTTKPEVTTTKPEVTTTKPEVTTTKPVEVTTTEPPVVTPPANVEEVLVAAGYKLSKYVKLELSPTLKAYYNSTSATHSNLVTTADNSPNFWATTTFTKDQLPVGSVLVVMEGYQYRPEGWQTLGTANTEKRPDNVTTSVVEIDEAWWNGFNYRAFNVSGTTKIPSVTEADLAGFAIFVPDNSGIIVDVDVESDKVTDAKENATFQTVGTPVFETITVVHNGVEKEVKAVSFKDKQSLIIGTLSQFDTEAKMNEFLAAGFSIEAFYIDKSTVTAGVVCMTEGGKGFGVADQNDGKPYFITGNGGGYNAAYANNAATEGELVHVVATYNPTEKVHTIYVNGVECSKLDSSYPGTNISAVVAANAISGATGVKMFNVFCMGGDLRTNNDLNGDFLADGLTIVDAKIYSKVLTAAEALAAYTAATKDFVTEKGIYVDVDFNANGTITDAKNNATFAGIGGTPVVETVTVKHNGVELKVPALKVSEAGKFVYGTFKKLDTTEKMQAFLDAGFSVEAFYLDNSTSTAGIVCMTENPTGVGQSGWGIAHASNKPYFITGNTTGWNAAYAPAVSDTELVHVVAVYDPEAKMHTIYVNGVECSDRTVYPGTNVPGINAIPESVVSKEDIAIFNTFCIGADFAAKVQNRYDFTANNLVVVDVKIHNVPLTADEVKTAYTLATVNFVDNKEPSSEAGLPTTPAVEGEFLAYVPAGNTAKAINLATGEVAGIITAGTGVTVKGGYIYVAEVKDGKIVATKEVGTAVSTTTLVAGWTLKRSADHECESWRGGTPGGSGYKNSNKKNFMINSIDFAKYNALIDKDLGAFGTITFTSIAADEFEIYFDGDADNSTIVEDGTIDGAPVKFVYVNYDGSDLKAATGTTWTPLGMSQIHLIREAIDKAWEKESGYFNDLWQDLLDTYGGYTSVKKVGDVYNGTTLQNATNNAYYAALITDKYNSALTNYKKLTVSDATVAAILATKDAAVAKAQKAFDDAVTANTAVKALKDAIAAPLAAYEAAQQANYEAQVAYETSKSMKGSGHADTVALDQPYKDATAAMNTAKAPYDAAVKAYNDAVAADETLAALLAALDFAKAEQKTAATNKGYVDTYNTYAPLYAKFLVEYEKAANVALWGDNLAESVIYNEFKDVADAAYPTFTYYYDAVAETYTIFVNSAKDANQKASW